MTSHPVPPRLRARRVIAAAGRGAVLAMVAASLGGCLMTAKHEDVTGDIPSDYRLRHPIAVKEAERTVEIFIGSRRGGLTAVQRAEVLAFAGSWRREATGGVIIDVPSGTANARAAREALHEVRALLHGAGVPPDAVEARGSQPADPARMATLRLNYPRMVAQAGPCGTWPNDLGPTMDPLYNHNRPYWNLGCASQRNLAAMVENPADLVQPRAETGAYSNRRSTVFEKYRKGESPATTYPNADKGTISDVGR